jgi:endonuclease YncB( thermonuclease family)
MARRNKPGISGFVVLAALFAVTFSVFSSDDKQFNSPPRVAKSQTVALTVAAEDKEIVAHCERVVDGDTFKAKLEDGTVATIRLHGIDTPESDQAFGFAATNQLRKRITGRALTLKITDKDRYGRLVATVYVRDLNVNHELVRSGLAWHYVK